MSDPLSTRLRLLRQALRRRGQGEEGAFEEPAPAGGGQADSAESAAGGEQATGEGRWQAKGLLGWERVGELTYRRMVSFDNPLAGEEVSEHLLPPGLSLRDLLFLDTETTGLSGGAGTVVFLIGTGRLEADRFEVEQLFLADYPGEPDFLERLRPALQSARHLVSYNGRTFDAPILASRFALNRLPLESRGHSDLLYWARRLWKRVLGDCSLASIEREVLGVERFEDVPGFEVPGIYQEYLRHGWSPRLPLVWEHNSQDVHSLGLLFARLNRLLSREEAPARTDLASLGSWLLGAGRPERGLELLRRSFADGDDRAGRELSLHLKRSGRWEEAVEVWQLMVGRRQSLFAAVELAKHAEHRLKDPRCALSWVERAEAWGLPLDGGTRRELSLRRSRLERRARRGSS